MENIKKIAKMLDKLGFPAKPTKKQLLLYKEAIYKTCYTKKNPEILVLGANPEIRDLCIKYNCSVTAVSPGSMALRAMSYLMKYKDSPKNKSIESNWLNMPLPNNSYDLVLTDIALTANPCGKHEQILKEVNRVLKPGGFFFLRTFDMLDHEKKPEPPEFLEELRNGEITKGDFLYLSARIPLDKHNNIDQTKNLKLFESYCKEGKLTSQEIKIIKPYASDGVMSCPYRKDMIKRFEKFFDNISIKFATDPKIKTVQQNALFFMRVKK
ncbi:class I SAM-dependent methyltransferase [Candidatus Dependentiae bacterium]